MSNTRYLNIFLWLALIYFFYGCSSTSETTYTETEHIKADPPPITATVEPKEEVKIVRDLPDTTQKQLEQAGYTKEDTVTIETAKAETKEGTISATTYKAKNKKTQTHLRAQSAPVWGEKESTIKATQKRTTLQLFSDLLEKNKYFLAGFAITLVIVVLIVVSVISAIKKKLML